MFTENIEYLHYLQYTTTVFHLTNIATAVVSVAVNYKTGWSALFVSNITKYTHAYRFPRIKRYYYIDKKWIKDCCMYTIYFAYNKYFLHHIII